MTLSVQKLILAPILSEKIGLMHTVIPTPQASTDALWRSFGDYVCTPSYTNNKEQRGAVRAWFDELYARRNDEPITLKRHVIEHAANGNAKYAAYSLNEQMYFSTSPLVLTLPHPSADTETRSDRHVGVWLHDFGKPDDRFNFLYDREVNSIQCGIRTSARLNKVQLEIIDNPFLNAVMTATRDALDASRQLGVAATTIGPCTLKIATTSPEMMHRHRDTRNDTQENKWGRVILTALKHVGTGYALGKDETVPVTCPPGATGAHIGFKYETEFPGCKEMGALHWGNGHPEGRAVLLSETQREPYRPERLPTSPWRIITPL